MVSPVIILTGLQRELILPCIESIICTYGMFFFILYIYIFFIFNGASQGRTRISCPPSILALFSTRIVTLLMVSLCAILDRGVVHPIMAFSMGVIPEKHNCIDLIGN